MKFWVAAMEGDAGTREALWREARQSRSGWGLAMLQSLPGSPHYDPEAADQGLRTALKRGLPEDEAALARMRLAELNSARQCRDEVVELRSRVTRIIDIEREIDNGR